MSAAGRRVIARRTAWAMFCLMMAATLAAGIVPQYFPMSAWVPVAAVALAVGIVARVYLWRLGGKLDDGFRSRNGRSAR